VVLTALRGGLAFLTRLPVGGGAAEWEAFRRTPLAFPLAGYVVGLVASLPFLVPLPVPTAAALYLATLYLVTGVTHADGLADLGDAAAVHGAVDRTTEALKDSATGVGGALALGLALVGLGLGALGVAGTRPRVAFALVLAAEVGAKAGMATLVCTGDPAHEGLGSALAGDADPTDLLPVAASLLGLLAVVPAAGFAGVAAAALAPVGAAWLVGRWAAGRLGGVSGDVFGAANELGRVAGVHAGVIAWTLF
jgi:adenosylcobinamide-GDP ribazoletransferase